MVEIKMYYLCLECGKLLHGLGLKPHFSYNHKEIYEKMYRIPRKDQGWSRFADYFTIEGKLVAVCVGESKYYYKRSVDLWIKTLQGRSEKVKQALAKELKELEMS